MERKPYFTEKHLLQNIFFAPNMDAAEGYLKRNNVKFSAVKLHTEQLEHSANWNTYKYFKEEPAKKKDILGFEDMFKPG